MNWDAIGAIGEIIGAMAVVASLAYLALQIRMQNREARLSGAHDILVGFRESLQAFTHGDLHEIFARANEEYDSLSNAELIRLFGGVLPILRLWEEAYIQNEQGRLEDRLWEGINSQYSAYLNYGAVSRIWEIRRIHFDKSFQNFVQDLERSELRLR